MFPGAILETRSSGYFAAIKFNGSGPNFFYTTTYEVFALKDN